MGNTCNFNVESSKVGETQFEVTGKDNKTYYMIRKKDFIDDSGNEKTKPFYDKAISNDLKDKVNTRKSSLRYNKKEYNNGKVKVLIF